MTVTHLMTVAIAGPTLSNFYTVISVSIHLQGYILENTLHTKERAQKETHHDVIINVFCPFCLTTELRNKKQRR